VGGVVDYLCNSFLVTREEAWTSSIARQGVPVKTRRDDDDSFTDPDRMVARMDELGIATLLLVTGDPHHGNSAFNFSEITATWDETARLVKDYPGRFAALWSLDPTAGMVGVRRASVALAEGWVVGTYNHVHSYDRPFDHADFYPYYALCADADVPVVMQAGTSGGLVPSECGRPIGIDRPAIYFPDTVFVLSHTGWPWVTEAIAMALKFPNVYLGTASYPPKYWTPEVVDFLSRGGRRKVLFGTNFPTVGHRQALAQLDALELPDAVRSNLLEGTARSIFHRLT
jgi:predicted TIM-barrel fold metal-dependent hydrolase